MHRRKQALVMLLGAISTQTGLLCSAQNAMQGQGTQTGSSAQSPILQQEPTGMTVRSRWFGKEMTVGSPQSTKSGQTASPSESQSIPMQQFPIESVAPGKQDTSATGETAGSDLELTAKYFSDEADVRAAYKQACEQKAAHFNEPAYYYRKAAILIQMGEYSKAGQELKGLLADIPNNSDYHLAQAYCYYKLGQKTAALDEVGMARFHNPRLPANITFK
ncbi:MAG TPA: hypothetical protein V6C86_24885 [Oculatellaceae cyanobacterium]